MTPAQLEKASDHYLTRHAAQRMMSIPLLSIQMAMANHWQRCCRMPAGGYAGGGGSQQTGFEMELISAPAAQELFRSWPNHQIIRHGRSWECRTMNECVSALHFEDAPAGWGYGNAKPAPFKTGFKEHRAIVLIAPPLTATWTIREDTSTLLVLRAPIVVYTENDVVLLPPDDKDGVPFYVDPPGQPGMHRDLFKGHARVMLRKLEELSYPLSTQLSRLGDQSPLPV